MATCHSHLHLFNKLALVHPKEEASSVLRILQRCIRCLHLQLVNNKEEGLTPSAWSMLFQTSTLIKL